MSDCSSVGPSAPRRVQACHRLHRTNPQLSDTMVMALLLLFVAFLRFVVTLCAAFFTTIKSLPSLLERDDRLGYRGTTLLGSCLLQQRTLLCSISKLSGQFALLRLVTGANRHPVRHVLRHVSNVPLAGEFRNTIDCVAPTRSSLNPVITVLLLFIAFPHSGFVEHYIDTAWCCQPCKDGLIDKGAR